MPATSEQSIGAKGLSVRQLTLIFFGGVAVCAIFFALGFLVGSNGRNRNTAAAVTEQVSAPSEIPPPVNPPLDNPAPGSPSQSAPNSQTPSVIEQDLKPTAPRAAPAGIVVQVAASHTQQDAQSLVQTLEAHGYAAFLTGPQPVGTGEQIYRVQVGPFASHAQALAALHKLSRQGFKPFIKE